MLAAGVKTPVPLEELEGHLREEFEQQMKSGLGGAPAFSAAVQNIGPATLLQDEFQKQTAKSRRRAVYYRFAALSLGCMLISVAGSIPLMHSHEAFNRTCGRIAFVASIIGAAGLCLQAAAFYTATRKSRR